MAAMFGRWMGSDAAPAPAASSSAAAAAPSARKTFLEKVVFKKDQWEKDSITLKVSRQIRGSRREGGRPGLVRIAAAIDATDTSPSAAQRGRAGQAPSPCERLEHRIAAISSKSS